MSAMKLQSPNRSWMFFFREYPGQTALMGFLFAISGLLESLGAVSLVPLLGTLVGGETQSSPLLTKINSIFLYAGIEPTVENLVVVICMAMLMKMVLVLLAFQQAGYIEADMTTRLRMALLDGLLSARWSYFVSRPSGELTTALSVECSQVGLALRTMGQFTALAIQACSYFAAGILVSWDLFVMGILGGGLFFVLFRKLISYVRSAGKNQNESMNLMLSTFTDALAGAKPLKVMGAEEQVVGHVREQVSRFQEAAKRHVFGMSLMNALPEPLITVLLAGGVYVAISVFHMEPTLLLAMAFFMQRFLSRISSAQQTLQYFVALEAALESLLSKLDDIRHNREKDDGGDCVWLKQGIELREVDFAYEDKRVLNKFNFNVPFGKITALCGPSGMGKTTVSDLITGLISPHSGSVCVDGVPMQSMSKLEWRKQVGYVPQEVFLFNDTVRSNITLGREFPDGDVWKALERAGARRFIEGLPEGLDFCVGEHGRALSGGQRQRLMIARAIIGSPRLLILDEATTGLDSKTEDDILTSVAGMKAEMAVLAISHQPAVKQVADFVYDLSDEACKASEHLKI